METGNCCCLLKLTIVFFAAVSSQVHLKVNANETSSDKKYESVQKLEETSEEHRRRFAGAAAGMYAAV